MKLKKCPKCKNYTLKNKCQKCLVLTKEAHTKYRERFLKNKK